MEEYNSMNARFQKIVCDCYAVYKLSVNDGVNQFVYTIDYETENEAIDYVERVYNLSPNHSNAFVIIPVKKNACGQLFSNEINITKSFISYTDCCKVALMDSENPFLWINVYNLKAGVPTSAIGYTNDPLPENWVSNPTENADELFIVWNL